MNSSIHNILTVLVLLILPNFAYASGGHGEWEAITFIFWFVIFCITLSILLFKFWKVWIWESIFFFLFCLAATWIFFYWIVIPTLTNPYDTRNWLFVSWLLPIIIFCIIFFYWKYFSVKKFYIWVLPILIVIAIYFQYEQFSRTSWWTYSSFGEISYNK